MFRLSIDTDNAAFQEYDDGQEVARILRDVADKIDNGKDSGPVFDINGNRVGRYTMNGTA